jgi:hypothetical protein
VKNLEEIFQYDSQNRLTEVWLGTTLTGASAHDSYGRMTSKTAGGQAVFSSAVYSTVRTKRYVGNCEYVTETTGNTTSSRWLTYLTGSTGVYAVVKRILH